jgi:hypothetical protein
VRRPNRSVLVRQSAPSAVLPRLRVAASPVAHAALESSEERTKMKLSEFDIFFISHSFPFDLKSSGFVELHRGPAKTWAP